MSAKVDSKTHRVPSMTELGYPAEEVAGLLKLFPGGETAALKRMREKMADTDWVVEFEKPKTSPTARPAKPATTVLSPYLKFGCLSPRLFYHKLKEIEKGALAKGVPISKPPVSLEGQLLWREFFYLNGHGTPNYDKAAHNPRCRKIPWDNDEALLRAWTEGKTGYPWIDACMVCV